MKHIKSNHIELGKGRHGGGSLSQEAENVLFIEMLFLSFKSNINK